MILLWHRGYILESCQRQNIFGQEKDHYPLHHIILLSMNNYAIAITAWWSRQQKLYYDERKGKRALLGFVLQICFSIPQLALPIFDYKNKLICLTSAWRNSYEIDTQTLCLHSFLFPHHCICLIYLSQRNPY